MWCALKMSLLSTTENTLRTTNGKPPLYKGAKWWNDDVANAIKLKKEAFKAWKNGGNHQSYRKKVLL